MKNHQPIPINDIEHCLVQAQHLNIRHPFCQVFAHLAGDTTTGLVAYAIWCGRAQVISTLYWASDYLQSGARISRASQARSCWQEEGVTLDDLPRQGRLDG